MLEDLELKWDFYITYIRVKGHNRPSDPDFAHGLNFRHDYSGSRRNDLSHIALSV